MYLNGYDDQLGFAIPGILARGVSLVAGGRGRAPSISASDFINQLERAGAVSDLQDIADDGEGPGSQRGTRHRYNLSEQLQAREALTRIAPAAAPSVESAVGNRIVAGVAPPAAPATVSPQIAGLSPALLLGAVGLVGAFLLGPKLLKRRGGYRGNPHRRRSRRRSRARRR